LRKTTSVSCFLSISLSVLVGASSAQAIYDIGNAGGGLQDQGQYMTFYTAQIPVAKSPLTRDEVKGMNFLLQQISELQVSPNIKAQLNDLVLPSDHRNYFEGDENQISPEKRQEIILLYSQLMHVPPQEVVIYALTDPGTGNTFLMPEFAKLNNFTEQAAILFHESLWLSSIAQRSDQKDYANVIADEEIAQAYFEDQFDGKKYYAFYNMLASFLSDQQLALKAAFNFDQHLPLPWAVKKNQKRILATEILNEKFLHCSLSNSYPGTKTPDVLAACNKALFNDLIEVAEKNPESLFVKALIDSLEAEHYVNIDLVTSLLTQQISNGYDHFAEVPLNEKQFSDLLKHLYVTMPASDSSDNLSFSLESEDGSFAGSLNF